VTAARDDPSMGRFEVSAAPPEERAAERTFLIADVRGYTRFTRERGDAAAARLAKTFADLARDAVEARSGRVIELRGDEALAVFASPAAAVRAATELVAVCAEEAAADPDLPLLVGIGIDVGEAVPVEGGFRGAALNTAARLCSKAEGGQVLVTSGIAARAADLPGIRYVPRGAVELKGFEAPVELIEAAIEWPPAPLPSKPDEAIVELLPAELELDTPLVGRQHELSWLRGTWHQVRRGHGRAVFVSGPPQSGKTRLAAELGAHALTQGAFVTYVGAGGAGAALGLSALVECVPAPRPTVLVLDDLDALGERVAKRLGEHFEEVEAGALLIIGIVRDPYATPGLAALVERADARGDGHRTLAALEPVEIQEIARLYAGLDVDDVPLESIGRASGGLPGAVHELMSEWADEEATRRLSAAAEWLAMERTARKADLEFANNVIALKLARLYGRGGADGAADEGACPYKGLASFDESDARLFFGRERLVGELAARTVGPGLLAVVGPSGGGKSSLVAAGLLPSLRAGLLPGSERWDLVVIRPGEHPMEELGAVRTDAGDGRLVLVVDQFEEVFTTCHDEEERGAFIDSLTERAVRDPEGSAVVLSLRGDFIDDCAAYPHLAELISANQVIVGPMTHDELRRAIELPARRVGLRVERALVDSLVSEVADEPGGLPLLSTALVELWQNRTADWLRMDAYERTGGVRGAVARLAESAFEHLDTPQREAARSIFLRLVATGEGDAVTRRRVPIAEFDVDRNPVASAVLTRLTEDRLLTRGDGSVEVAHEALLREWPRLQAWLHEDVQGRHLRQHLTQAAAQWAGAGRDASELYRGARLSAALDWAALHGRELNELEREFLTASRAAGEREAERQRRTNRRLRGLLAGVSLLLLAAVGAGSFALVQRGQARHSAKVALADSLGAQAIADPHLDRAMLLGVEGVKLHSSDRTQGDLLTALLRAPTAVRTFHGNGLRVNGLALSPDGRTLVIQDNVPNAILLNTSTGRRVGQFVTPGFPSSFFTASPDGKLVNVGQSGIELIASPTGKERRLLSTRFLEKRGVDTESVSNYAFAEGGRRLAAAVGSGPATYVVQWALPSGRRLARLIHVPDATAVAYTIDGKRLVVVGSEQTSLLDSLTGRRVRVYDVSGGTAALSTDGRTLVTGDVGGSVRFLDLRTGAVDTSVSAHDDAVVHVGFTPDGKTAITSGEDGKARVWDVATRRSVRTLVGHAGRIHGQAISPDGSTLYTGSFDTTALAWDLSGTRSFGRTFRGAESDPNAGAPNVAISPDGSTVAVGATDGTVNIWDARSLRKRQSFRAGPGLVAAVSFSPNGRSLLVAGDTNTRPPHGYIGSWRLGPTPRLLHKLKGLPIYTWASFSPDGKVIAATGPSQSQLGEAASVGDGLVAEWDAASGRLLAKPTHIPGGGYTDDLSFAASGTAVAVSQFGNMAAVVDPARREVLAHWKTSSDAELTLGVALAPDARRVATTDFNGFLRVWDASSGRAVLPPIHASEVDVTGVEWSPDGSRLVTAGGDGTVRLYNAKTGQQIGTSLPIARQLFTYATFSPDGRTIVATDAAGQVWMYPGTAAGWAAYACRLANRNLTRSEWSRLVPGHAYGQICPVTAGR
jgi:WD40 repeat protein/class 3 adenylate cyclase